MKYILEENRNEDVICLGDEIVYGRRKEWGSSTYRQLKLSLLAARQHWSYDPHKKLPLILWICGGGFTHMDINVWMPELVFYAKNGFAVASIEYSTMPNTVYPAQTDDIREAMSFLAENADEFHLDLSRSFIMGESAGAYLAGLIALTGEKDDMGEKTCTIKGAVLLYPPVVLGKLPGNVIIDAITMGAPDLTDLVSPSAPPFFIVHGMNDSLVPCEQSEKLYAALERENVESELYLIRGCNHADSPAFQTPVKERILLFLKEKCEEM